MTGLPNGLLMKAYVVPVVTFVLVASVFVIVAPFWIIAIIFTAIVLALIGLIIWVSMQPTTGCGQ